MTQTQTVPLWLLDVDGVINAVCGTVPPGYQRERINGYQITWSPQIIERMRHLHETGAVEIRWLTTWCDLAASHIAPALGLPLDCVVEGAEDHQQYRPRGWWKSTTAKRLSDAEPDRPLIWTDDDLSFAEIRGEVDWLKERTAPTLALCPDGRQGITPKMLRRVDDFLAAVSEQYRDLDQIREELRGKNLACWCPLDQPCHADVLLELANNSSPSVPPTGGSASGLEKPTVEKSSTSTGGDCALG